jgi:radical SAM superfamily enzyme YgiQ (UPF0313 family)
VRVLLVSTYDLGRQPFGLASPAAWLRRADVETLCVDTSRESLSDEAIRQASIVAVYLPMHTATRLAAAVIDRVRLINPDASLVAYGLYAPLNAAWLRERGVSHVLGPEAEEDLARLANSQLPTPNSQGADLRSRLPRLQFIQPDRSTLLPLQRYAALQMPDGSRRVVGATEGTRGCKHLCRHCPIVPVYRGAFRAIPVDVVLDDVRSQVAAGAQHISFGDPDFFNGPSHARRIVERLAVEHPGISYDVTIKIEHLLTHADMLPLLHDTGCLFVTSAVESIDPVVLDALRKGHTREDFVEAVALCRKADVRLSPTFVPFTPWTTPAGYVELLEQLAALGLEEDVAPIQLGIRLLVTADSALLELSEIRDLVETFEPESLTFPWRHRDRAVDRLQSQVMQVVAGMPAAPRREVFDAIDAVAREAAQIQRLPPEAGSHRNGNAASALRRKETTAPHMTEAWYCCAEPTSAEASASAPGLPQRLNGVPSVAAADKPVGKPDHDIASYV